MNEKGTVLPAALIFCMIFLMALAASASLFLTEKKFYYEAAEKVKADHLLQLGTEDILDMLAKENDYGNTGFFFYLNGDVYYQINTVSGLLSVHLYITTKADRKLEAIFNYNQTEKKVVEWIEI
ncbi:competence type IV pilus minor pilin ComGG [Peribacillus kribbensis]|uniref:competence type IV pilus minor pilin ComGG n=1 Tax=Peribacillus kribbensis TaxID=356658 RepID=UPI0003FC1BB5|nr:competence type IV pilus minor pilin ComGG [Peribacillus kribbensis]